MSSFSVQYLQRDNVEIVRVENAFAQAEFSLFGGQMLSFIPHHDQRDRLWLSEKAIFDGTRPIRGGIPICWPWFGAAPDFLTDCSLLPAHGYVRTCQWEILEISDCPEGTRVILQPSVDYSTQVLPHLHVTLQVLIGQQLTIDLITVNQGSKTPFYAALHSYFALDDIHSTQLDGLNYPYWDKVTQRDNNAAAVPYTITGETDRIHAVAAPTVTIKAGNFQTQVHSSGHDSIVVWNPWQDLSQSMPDMSADGFRQMLCVETARTQANNLAHQQTHCLSQTIV